VAFVGVVLYGSIWALQVMCTDLLSPTSNIWWRWFCGSGITAIVIVYFMVVKTIFVNRVWLPLKDPRTQVVKPNRDSMYDWEELVG